MSRWRHEASQRLPELQRVIASRKIHTPAELWIALWLEFDDRCRWEPAPGDLLSRIWQFARWSAHQDDEAVHSAVISYFFENLANTRRYRDVLLSFMSRQEYEFAIGERDPREGNDP